MSRYICFKNIYYVIFSLAFSKNRIYILCLHCLYSVSLVFVFIEFYKLISSAELKRGVSDHSPQIIWGVPSLLKISKVKYY